MKRTLIALALGCAVALGGCASLGISKPQTIRQGELTGERAYALGAGVAQVTLCNKTPITKTCTAARNYDGYAWNVLQGAYTAATATVLQEGLTPPDASDETLAAAHAASLAAHNALQGTP